MHTQQGNMNSSVHNNASAASPRRRGYRGLSAEELRRQRQQRLIEAGIALFGERGYAATPIEAVCSQAKVSTRHFYEQFEGRESILHAVYDALVAALEGIVRASLTGSREPLAQRVANTIEATVHHMLADPRRGRILCIEAVGVSAGMERKRRATTHALARVIQRYARMLAARGELPQRDYRLPAVAMVGMFNELVAEWLTEDTGLSAAEMAREAKILFRAMLFGAQHYRATERPPAPGQPPASATP